MLIAKFGRIDPATVRERIVEIGATEATHVAVLKSVLGKKATKPCTYSFPYDSVDSFLALSAAIEGVGVSAYLGAAPLITSKVSFSVFDVQQLPKYICLTGLPGGSCLYRHWSVSIHLLRVIWPC